PLVAREIDSVRVKGKKEPVKVFELRRRGATSSAEQSLLDGYSHALKLYREQRFSAARGAFEQCLAIDPDDGPSQLFVARCDAMTGAPPGAGWGGVFSMTRK